MPEPTVWAVYDGTEFVTALRTEDAAHRWIADRWHEPPRTFRVAPMALVTPEALAVVEAAAKQPIHWAALLDAVRAFQSTLRGDADTVPEHRWTIQGIMAEAVAATAREDKGGDHG